MIAEINHLVIQVSRKQISEAAQGLHNDYCYMCRRAEDSESPDCCPTNTPNDGEPCSYHEMVLIPCVYNENEWTDVVMNILGGIFPNELKIVVVDD